MAAPNGNVLKTRMDRAESDIQAIESDMKEASRVNNDEHHKVSKAFININWKLHILIAAVLVAGAHSENVVYKLLIGLIG